MICFLKIIDDLFINRSLLYKNDSSIFDSTVTQNQEISFHAQISLINKCNINTNFYNGFGIDLISK